MKIDLTIIKLNFKDSTGVIKSPEMRSSCYWGLEFGFAVVISLPSQGQLQLKNTLNP